MTGAATSGAPSGISSILSKATGNTTIAISMITVPETTGVMIRRSNGSQVAIAN